MSRWLRNALVTMWAVWACVVSGCERPAPVLQFEDANLRLSLTDASLLEDVESFIAVMLFAGDGVGCAELLELSPADLDARWDAQSPLSSAQVVPVGGDLAPGTHAFGRVAAPGPYSYLILGSLLEKNEGNFPANLGPLEAATGSVVAMGCRDLDVVTGKRYDLDLVLFPAGLR